MTYMELQELQAKMSDADLVENAEKQIRRLSISGGKSHTMCVPPKITDTDMIFSELVRRFKEFSE